MSNVLQTRIEQAFKDYFTLKIGYIGQNFYLLKTQYLILRNLNVTIMGEYLIYIKSLTIT